MLHTHTHKYTYWWQKWANEDCKYPIKRSNKKYHAFYINHIHIYIYNYFIVNCSLNYYLIQNNSKNTSNKQKNWNKEKYMPEGNSSLSVMQTPKQYAYMNVCGN